MSDWQHDGERRTHYGGWEPRTVPDPPTAPVEAYYAAVRAQNGAVYAHELDTPMREHTATCCAEILAAHPLPARP